MQSHGYKMGESVFRMLARDRSFLQSNHKKMLPAALLLSLFIGVVVCEDDETMALHFLNQYGYISNTGSGNHDVDTAIRQFQDFYGLHVTGKLDASTVELMKKPRCGTSDPTPGSRLRRYVTVRKWSKKDLKYFVQPGQDLPHDQQRQIFGQALQFWAEVSGLTFSEVGSASEADIKISFGRNTHGGTNVEGTCPYPFEGSGGTVGHAFFPEDGRVHFDEDETFTHETSSGINLLSAAVHEFGHALGLDHSNIQGSIMYAYYAYVPDMQLHSDDVAGIQYLYGENSGDSGGEETPAPTVSGNCEDLLTAQCQFYKDAGYCNKHPDNMKQWCEKTCFNCQG